MGHRATKVGRLATKVGMLPTNSETGLCHAEAAGVATASDAQYIKLVRNVSGSRKVFCNFALGKSLIQIK